MWIYSYDFASNGARELAESLNAKRIRREGSLFKGGQDKTVINWGALAIPEEVQKCRIINTPEQIRCVSNKLEFFRSYSHRFRSVPWTVNQNEAEDWYMGGATVVARTALSGSGGLGIVFCREGEERLVSAPLYTRYIPKKHEYRVHFMNGEIIDYQRKALNPDFNQEEVDWRLRNLENGFIFVRGDVTLPPDVLRQAEVCAHAVDLTFGAIDLIFNEKAGRAYVLEVNSAPGLMGTTVARYANAFRNLLGE